MSGSGEIRKAGNTNDLRGKSMEELMEILERQEKLLNNKTFLARLPDRGKKISDFTEKVRQAIADLNELKRTTDLLSAFRLEFSAQQSIVKERTREHNTEALAQLERTEGQSVAANPLAELPANENKVNMTEPQHKVHLDTPLIPANNNKAITRNDTSTDKICFDTDTLVNDIKKISLKDSNELISKRTPETSSVHESNPVPQSASQTKSHFIEVIEKRARSPVQKKDKFRTNKLPSGSSSSSQSQSPGGWENKPTPEERRVQDKKHLDDITSARLPPLHHAPAQLLPLEESVALQLAQKQTYEEQQAKLAAQRLLEKLNIKMVKFNPEGDSYMKYRDLKDTEENDD
ncbi:protein GRINL1A [Rhinophrynus dorsalis]